MAKNITGRFLNQEKREHEAVVVTVPALYVAGGGRSNVDPEYIQYGEALTASVVPAEIISGKCYLVVEEAFPAGTTITVTGLGATLFSAVSVAALGITVSASVDRLATAPSDLVITVGHATSTGDVTTGKAKIVMDYIPYTVKNGRFAANPAL